MLRRSGVEALLCVRSSWEKILMRMYAVLMGLDFEFSGGMGGLHIVGRIVWFDSWLAQVYSCS